MRKNHQFGLTLIEMLIVLGIIGILGVGALSVFAREGKQAQIRTVQSGLVSDISQARSASQKLNLWRSIIFVDGSSYEIRQGTSLTDVTSNTPIATKQIPTGVLVQAISGSSSSPTIASIGSSTQIIYKPPFGLLSTSSPWAMKISSSSNTSLSPLYVKVVGLTGKVITSASY